MAQDLLALPAYAYPRRAPPRHALPIRPAGRPRAADHPIAACAPLPQQCDFVLAQGRARAALHQLAAGPVCQLPGAAGLPGEDARVQGHGGPGGGDGGVQPLRLLPGARGRAHPLQVQQRCAAGAGALPGHRADDAAGAGVPGQDRPQQTTHSGLSGQAEPAGVAGHSLPDPPGARRADARGDAAKGQRLVPRLGLAAGAAAAPPGAGGTVCVGLPDPADPRREGAGWPQRHRPRLHRPARLVRGLPARRGLDWPGCHQRPDGGRRPHSAGLHAATLGGRTD